MKNLPLPIIFYSKSFNKPLIRKAALAAQQTLLVTHFLFKVSENKETCLFFSVSFYKRKKLEIPDRPGGN